MNKSYELVCGAAFEDLSQDEMMKFEGGGPGITVLSTTTWACIGVSALVSAAVTITVAAFG